VATKKIDPRKADSTDVEVGRLVRALRMSHGLSHTELANRIGVPFQQVQKYETGTNRISMGRLANVAKLFDVFVPYLLDGNKKAAARKSRAKDSGDYTEALEMLGRIGAQRLLKAYLAIPEKPASLRDSIVRLVEGTATAAAVSAAAVGKRRKRKELERVKQMIASSMRSRLAGDQWSRSPGDVRGIGTEVQTPLPDRGDRGEEGPDLLARAGSHLSSRGCRNQRSGQFATH